MRRRPGDILDYVSRLKKDLGDFEEDYQTLGSHIRHAATKYDDADRKLARFGDKLRLSGETPAGKLAEGAVPPAEESRREPD
jgi:DNA anti-recombination protein RmuC